MKPKFFFVAMMFAVLLIACSASAETPAEPLKGSAPVLNSSGVTAGDASNPFRFLEIAFTASGVVQRGARR